MSEVQLTMGETAAASEQNRERVIAEVVDRLAAGFRAAGASMHEFATVLTALIMAARDIPELQPRFIARTRMARIRAEHPWTFVFVAWWWRWLWVAIEPELLRLLLCALQDDAVDAWWELEDHATETAANLRRGWYDAREEVRAW